MSQFKPPVPSAGQTRNFILIMLALLLAMLVSTPAILAGDAEEYGLLTIAVASHGTPDIRQSDIDKAKPLMPGFVPALAILEQGMREQRVVPQPGFYRGSGGSTQAIHFFGYSALAAVPFKFLQLAGLPPLKCYQVLNLTFVLILGLSLLRLFGSIPKALAGVALFMLCGGYLYWGWSSPEVVSSAALLAGLVWFCSGAPLLGGLLTGIACLQNPSIVVTLGAVPLLACYLHYRSDLSLMANLRAILSARVLAGLALGFALFLLPPLYNMAQFGVPSIIAKIATDKSLISLMRLHSLYFDLNQGMIVAIPGVAAALLLWGWRGAGGTQRRARAMALAVVVLLSVAYALPALSVGNWNSGAAGVMRYAFWSAMPFVFLLLWRLRDYPRWPLVPVALVAVVQVAAMSSAHSYSHVEFSPLARWVMRTAPSLYNPEPEIFSERSEGKEDYMDAAKVYTVKANGVAVKSMYSRANPHPELLCGKEPLPPADATLANSPRQWVYVNGALDCGVAVTVGVAQFVKDGQAVLLGGGWSALENKDGQGGGVWSDGNKSTMMIAFAPGQRYATLSFSGFYMAGNVRTRVRVNGADLGWFKLQDGARVTLPHQETQGQSLLVEMEHEAPHSPGPQDGRQLAFFLKQVTLR